MKLNKIASLNAKRVLYVLVVCISFTISLEINISSNVYAEKQLLMILLIIMPLLPLLLTLH